MSDKRSGFKCSEIRMLKYPRAAEFWLKTAVLHNPCLEVKQRAKVSPASKFELSDPDLFALCEVCV